MSLDIRLAVVGSRTFTDKRLCWKILDQLKFNNDYNYTLIVSGGAKGADTYGEQYADYHNIEKLIFLPDWKKFGKKAGFLRNVDIIDNCDVCIAFWNRSSHGTQYDIQLCKEKNKICWVYNFLTNELYQEY